MLIYNIYFLEYNTAKTTINIDIIPNPNVVYNPQPIADSCFELLFILYIYILFIKK